MKNEMDKIAVVGMAGIFPGAKDVTTFGTNIMNKRECIIDIPQNRWLIPFDEAVSTGYRPDTACSKRAGLITDFHFDPSGFPVDPDILSRIDPLHKMVLHAGRDALSHCFYNGEIRKRTGVILAAISLPTEKTSEMAWQIIMENKAFNLTMEDALIAGIVSVPAELLARVMEFSGGAYTLDAACASSLYAIKIACDQLNSHKTDMMIAGGVSRPDSLYTQIGFTQLKALSPSGTCSPFDRNADGLVVGEGAGIVVLKRLEDALACGDRISGLITGTGWSNDIDGSLVAPASDGQVRAMAAAYKSAGWSPADVQLIECHGSATPVGDNIELGSMKTLWEDAGAAGHLCAIGSIKSMTGHLLTAAGAAGFIKTLTAMQEKLLPPSLNFTEAPEGSPLYTTGFKVQTAPEAWPAKPLKNDPSSTARRAGISAFGFGGINAHILVESFSPGHGKTFFPNSPKKNKITEKKSSQTNRAEDSGIKGGGEDSGIKSGVKASRIKAGAEDSGIKMDIAVIGMEIITPDAPDLEAFKHLIFRDKSFCSDFDCKKAGYTLDKKNCNHDDRHESLGLRKNNKDKTFQEIRTFPGEFHIPPNQIPDMLPQHLIMLKAAAGAVKDAGISPRPGQNEPARTKFGAAIGIEFDYGATDFYLGWRKRQELAENHITQSPGPDRAADLTADRTVDGFSPGLENHVLHPLTAERTLGALGGIVASRIAREFKLGGPCFTVSAGGDSGIKAIEIGIESLRRKEAELFICGSVDMAGDVRQTAINNLIKKISKPLKNSSEKSFSEEPLSSEGAAALILKPLEAAKRDGDRIYALIKETGAGSSGEMCMETINSSYADNPSYAGNPPYAVNPPYAGGRYDHKFIEHDHPMPAFQAACKSSLENALGDAGVKPSSIGLYLGDGTSYDLKSHAQKIALKELLEQKAITPEEPPGQDAIDHREHLGQDKISSEKTPEQDKISPEKTLRQDALERGQIDNYSSIPIGSTLSVVGDTHGVSSLISVIGAALSIYHRIIPASPWFPSPSSPCFHVPFFPEFWIKNISDNRRTACVGSFTDNGSCSHALLQEFIPEPGYRAEIRMMEERAFPIAPHLASALFVVQGETKNEVLIHIEQLKKMITPPDAGHLEQDSHSGMPDHLALSDSLSLVDNHALHDNLGLSYHHALPDHFRLTDAAFIWHEKMGFNHEKPFTLSMIAGDVENLKNLILQACDAVKNNTPMEINGKEGICYSPGPLQKNIKHSKIAFLYPGSGNHFPGMGRAAGILFPEILDAMDRDGASLKKRMLPDIYYPRCMFPDPAWEEKAWAAINNHAHNMIFGQVSFGYLMTRVAEKFSIIPGAAIGHSLGETAGLFALKAWNDPEEMLRRMENSDLFTKKLAGNCTAAASVWQLKPGEHVHWRAAAVNRSKEEVEKAVKPYDRLYILVINTPEETVIGGCADQLKQFIKKTGCGAMYLEGVVTVHCPVAEPCRDEYLALHRFPCSPPRGIDFYSCSLGRKYIPSTERTAESILNQALYGFDYTRLIENAWQDGIRIFLEMGPGASCTRAVNKILNKKEHLALSLSRKGEDDYLSLIKALASLAAHGVPFDLSPLFKLNTISNHSALPQKPSQAGQTISLKAHPMMPGYHKSDAYKLTAPGNKLTTPESAIKRQLFNTETDKLDIKTSHQSDVSAVADAHMKFLELSSHNMEAFEKQFAMLTQMASFCLKDDHNLNDVPDFDGFEKNSDHKYEPEMPSSIVNPLDFIEKKPEEQKSGKSPLFDRHMCMEFATGSAAAVLGEKFKVIDSYPVRVRLPDDPLMLVDRIMDIQGEMLSMGSGKIITQHDVNPGAWYLDGGKAPVSISIEAGQADLFLCSYLGIDHAVKGKRRYRLLDARVTFHRSLPEPGETIEYTIEIDRFLKQGEVYLFFFHYRGYIGKELLISMRDGCAGFFTPDEVENSGGIILKKEDLEPVSLKIAFNPLVPIARESYTDDQVQALRRGDLAFCFGTAFSNIVLGTDLRLPGGLMHLIDRVTLLEPRGGRFGLGFIRAEADIHPDAWFLTCHFIDDMVMPGTLMYECCAHALRIFTQRMGWITQRDDVYYDIIPGIESDLKCRGPVTRHTRKAVYEIEIKKIGYNPAPWVIADAHMFSDDHRIVLYKNMGMTLAGITQSEIELFWSQRSM